MRVVTVRQVAEHFGVATSTVEKWSQRYSDTPTPIVRGAHDLDAWVGWAKKRGLPHKEGR